MVHTGTPIDFSIAAMREWFKLPEGTRAEVIDENLIVLPSPSSYHSTVSANIKFEIWRLIRELDLGEIHDTPLDVFLKGAHQLSFPMLSISQERTNWL